MQHPAGHERQAPQADDEHSNGEQGHPGFERVPWEQIGVHEIDGNAVPRRNPISIKRVGKEM
jgi:hypothetical protein